MLHEFVKKHTYVVLAGLLAAGMLPVRIAAQSPEELNLTVGQTILLQYPADIGKVYYLTPPEVIEAQPTNTRELIVSGKALGATTLIVWNKTNEPTFYNVHVDLDTAGIGRAHV